MHLNTLASSEGSRKNRKRVGRGIGSGSGKTCGRGHKGQHSRSGGFHKTGFEGGQMPLQRRLPKIGFTSRIGRRTAEVRLSELTLVEGPVVDVSALKSANLISKGISRVRVIASGSINVPVTIRGLVVTKGARLAIENAQGTIEE